MKLMLVQRRNAYHDWIVLSFVGTHPDYQGRGAGSLLTQWGLKRAKADQIPVYLDSAVSASRLYEKLGFVAVDGLSMTIPGKEGGEQVYDEVSMLRAWDERS